MAANWHADKVESEMSYHQCPSCGGCCHKTGCQRLNTNDPVYIVETTDRQKAFEKWYGFEVGEEMDIQTSCAWENWQAAWNAAADLCNVVEDFALANYKTDISANQYFWNGVASGAGECASKLRDEHEPPFLRHNAM